MSVEPDLRIALGFILLLRLAISLTYADVLREVGIFAELQRNKVNRAWSKWLVWALLLFPLFAFLANANGMAWLVYAISPAAAEYTIMWLPEPIRWLLLFPAVGGLFMAILVRHCAAHPAAATTDIPLGQRLINGPYRAIRYPQWLANLVLFGALLVVTDNCLALISFFMACAVLRWVYLPQAEEAWKRMLGDGHSEYVSRTGFLLPKLSSLSDESAPHYYVPRRFGISAIIGLMTIFAVMFGLLNLFQEHITEVDFAPMLHLYFGLLLALVWIAQMRFGTAARSASVAVGALLLPVFILLHSNHSLKSWQLVVAAVLLGFFGGIIGYCMGAVAAGFFLVSDWLRPHLPWLQKSATTIGRTGTSPFSDSEDDNVRL